MKIQHDNLAFDVFEGLKHENRKHIYQVSGNQGYLKEILEVCLKMRRLCGNLKVPIKNVCKQCWRPLFSKRQKLLQIQMLECLSWSFEFQILGEVYRWWPEPSDLIREEIYTNGNLMNPCAENPKCLRSQKMIWESYTQTSAAANVGNGLKCQNHNDPCTHLAWQGVHYRFLPMEKTLKLISLYTG